MLRFSPILRPRSFPYRLVVVFSFFHFLVSSLLAQASDPGAPTGVRLGGNAQGVDAIRLLSSRLPEVAHAYGLDAQKLVTLLQTQPSLGVDQDGALFFECEAPALEVADVEAIEAAAAATATQTSPPTTAAQAFKLHSAPGASRVIYLDFDGHTTLGTSWNTAFKAGASLLSKVFDLDGNTGSFSSNEYGFIYRVWQRVAEDFAPFAVDVTTEYPGLEALRRTSASDSHYGVRVVISASNWYKAGTGGVAYVGSFNWGSDTPVFVFSSSLSNNEKAIAEACSHEVGHALGLHHDGKGSTQYYAGHGSWAPIMGASYYKAVTQWSSGQYSGASNKEDDLAIMPTYGAPLLPDDHGNSRDTASALSGPTVNDGGTIERRADIDYFKFQTGAGTISFSITGFSPQPNLDIQAQLLSSSGLVLQTSNPSGTSASISRSVSAGTYYLRVEGVGSGDPASTGYSDYGSVGDYAILGTIIATGNKSPVAKAAATPTSGSAPLAVKFSSSGSSDPDGTIANYLWEFGDGTTSASSSPSKTYSAGSYTAKLTVTDNDGAKASVQVKITSSAAASSGSESTTSGTAVVVDEFTGSGSLDDRPPDTTKPSGQIWQVENGSLSLGSGYAVANNTARAVIQSGVANCTVEAVVYLSSSSTGLMLRSKDSSNYLRLSLSPTGMSLSKTAAGKTSTIGSAKRTFATGKAYRLKAALSGSSIVVSVDGSVLGSFTSSFNQTATRHGLFASGSGARKWAQFKITR